MGEGAKAKHGTGMVGSHPQTFMIFPKLNLNGASIRTVRI